ncbi:MAG: hypothetical protein D6791_04745 [Chloroflexi bacterium]|nr:MAG: hypothetical protein D6791_04745 [Chloroflexota bacterium]
MTSSALHERSFLEDAAQSAVAGAVAGLLGGLFFGEALAYQGQLPLVAGLLRTANPWVGFTVHMLIAALVGAIFGVFVARYKLSCGAGLVWGTAYGLMWWFFGWLTLLPLALGQPMWWSVSAARQGFPDLIGHLVYGGVLGAALTMLRPALAGTLVMPTRERLVGPAIKGALAGLVGGAVFGAGMNSLDMTSVIARLVGAESAATGMLAHLGFGVIIGAGYGMLFGRSEESAGRALGRGVGYGFIWWVVGPLTIMPLALHQGLPWSLAAARSAFALLVGHILYGGFTALAYHVLDNLLRALFSDDVGLPFSEEGIGTQGLSAIARGVLGSVAGGLAFTAVMLHVGMLPRVAELAGATSPAAGFLVHMTISSLIGATYGLLFRRESYSFGAAAGWGVVYGLFWWALGGLTLFPVFLGGKPQWELAQAGQTFPSLMGHVGYGVATAVVYYALAERHSRWWAGDQEQTPAERDIWRGKQAASPGPALWTMSLVMVITLVVLFS